jgi:hypothetical protein
MGTYLSFVENMALIYYYYFKFLIYFRKINNKMADFFFLISIFGKTKKNKIGEGMFSVFFALSF